MIWLIRSYRIKRVDDCLCLIGIVYSRVLATTADAKYGICSRYVVEILDDLFGELVWVSEQGNISSGFDVGKCRRQKDVAV